MIKLILVALVLAFLFAIAADLYNRWMHHRMLKTLEETSRLLQEIRSHIGDIEDTNDVDFVKEVNEKLHRINDGI